MLFKDVCICFLFSAHPAGVHEAPPRLPELRDEERRPAARSRRLVGRQGLPQAADRLHGRRRDSRLLLPPPAASGETADTLTQRSSLERKQLLE